MDIHDKIIDKLTTEIEVIRRRKLTDYKSQQNISYIDPYNNVDKINTANNHIVQARRGCGKTSLLIKAISKQQNVLSIIYDCQLVRKFSPSDIIVKILIKLTEELYQEIHSAEVLSFISDYKKQNSGILGLLKKCFRKIDLDKKVKYENYTCLIKSLDQLKVKLSQLLDQPEELIATQAGKNSTAETFKRVNKSTLQTTSSADLSSSLSAKYKQLNGSLDLLFNFGRSFDSLRESSTSKETALVTEFSNTMQIRKIDVLFRMRDYIINLCNDYKRLINKEIFLYLDDFYQIDKASHPVVIQYFHDLYKACENKSFCFKIVTLPSALQINYKNEVTFSLKDDFSQIYLDFDLSNLDMLQTHLISIMCEIIPELSLTQNNFRDLFSNDEALKYVIIATGGIPRDFMVTFAELINIARRNGHFKITKDDIYAAIRNLKSDKDNNLEADTDISPSKVGEALKILNEFVDSYKTNVILYPLTKYESHEKLLKTLVNLRYLHIIKETVSSESKKIECKAYLVDMSFYACGRIPSSFTFCKFWEKDSSSRLNFLRRSTVWSFDEEFVKSLDVAECTN